MPFMNVPFSWSLVFGQQTRCAGVQIRSIEPSTPPPAQPLARQQILETDFRRFISKKPLSSRPHKNRWTSTADFTCGVSSISSDKNCCPGAHIRTAWNSTPSKGRRSGIARIFFTVEMSPRYCWALHHAATETRRPFACLGSIPLLQWHAALHAGPPKVCVPCLPVLALLPEVGKEGFVPNMII